MCIPLSLSAPPIREPRDRALRHGRIEWPTPGVPNERRSHVDYLNSTESTPDLAQRVSEPHAPPPSALQVRVSVGRSRSIDKLDEPDLDEHHFLRNCSIRAHRPEFVHCVRRAPANGPLVRDLSQRSVAPMMKTYRAAGVNLLG